MPHYLPRRSACAVNSTCYWLIAPATDYKSPFCPHPCWHLDLGRPWRQRLQLPY